MENIILALALVSVGVFVTLAMVIVHEVSKRGVKISILWLRLYIIKYIHQYKKLTKAETGKVGPLFYPCIASINMALVVVEPQSVANITLMSSGFISFINNLYNSNFHPPGFFTQN